MLVYNLKCTYSSRAGRGVSGATPVVVLANGGNGGDGPEQQRDSQQNPSSDQVANQGIFTIGALVNPRKSCDGKPYYSISHSFSFQKELLLVEINCIHNTALYY